MVISGTKPRDLPDEAVVLLDEVERDLGPLTGTWVVDATASWAVASMDESTQTSSASYLVYGIVLKIPGVETPWLEWVDDQWVLVVARTFNDIDIDGFAVLWAGTQLLSAT